jgi:hypothetical protein
MVHYALSLILNLVLLADPLTVRPVQPAAMPQLKTGQILIGQFRLGNTSTFPLQITDIQTSCGCQKVSVEAKTLAPGAETTLQFQVNTLTQAVGVQSWRATIHYQVNGIDHTAIADISAKLIREIDITPVQLAGVFEETYEGSILWKDRRPDAPAIASVTCSLKDVKVSISPKDAQGQQKITISARAELLPGDYADELHVKLPGQDYPDLRIPFRLTKTKPVAVKLAPEVLTLQRNANELTGLFALRHNKDQTIEITKVESSVAGLNSKHASAGSAASLKIIAPENQRPGTAKITIHFKDGSTVQGTVKW